MKGVDVPSNPTTKVVWINPWSLAKRLALREGPAGLPGSAEGDTAPGQLMLQEIGNADQSKRGAAWYRKEPGLEASCHKGQRRAELAAVRTQEARARTGRRAQLIERFYRRPEVEKLGVRRGMGHIPYFVALIAFTIVEGYLNTSALLLLGESEMRMVYAIGLGLGLMLLARFIGVGLKQRLMESAHAMSSKWIIGLSLTGAALIVALALMRAEALRLSILVATTQAQTGSVGSGSTTRTTTVPVPSVSWLLFAILQGAIFVAAIECSRQHSNALADEGEQLARKYRGAGRWLHWRMWLQARAETANDKARGQFGATFAATQEEADEAAHWNMVAGHRYGHYNLLSREGQVDSAMKVGPLPLADKEWRHAPDPEDRLGEPYYPATLPLWSHMEIPAPRISPPSSNGHGEPDRLVSISGKGD